MDLSMSKQVNALVSGLTAQLTANPIRSFMSASVYDTAWLAMVQHPESNCWLFPNCFDFILKNQLPGGGWDAYSSRLDGILNTAASLLAIKKHLKTQPLDKNLTSRANEAERALALMLENWDVSGSDQVGFELLVSRHVSMLREEGVILEFNGLDRLREIYQRKILQLPVESVYKGVSTLYHSLEAFIGHIDFDKVTCWQEENGSMMGSPSSTAAYLMHSSQWNAKAEEYLRNALRNCADLGGGVPSAWPTTVFETSWVFSVLAEAAIPIEENESSIIRSFLEQSLARHHGVVGFSPSTLPDADDTAKAIIALKHLGISIPVESLLKMFDAGTHFKTYRGERNPSFTVNCNVLICLLMMDDPRPYVSQIAKAAEFVCIQASTGKVNEKWHTHDLYWMMLLCQAFANLCEKVSEGSLDANLFEMSPQLHRLIPLVSLQILMNVRAKQDVNGSWDDVCELTAYAILTLSATSRLPWVRNLHDDGISASIHRGKCYLHNNRAKWDKGKYLWIEKVNFSSNILSEAYCIAAVVSELVSRQPNALHLFSPPDNITRKMSKCRALIQQTPLLLDARSHILQMAETQACYIFCLLQEQPLDIFPQSGNNDAKYKIITPIIWTACNALLGCPLSPSHLLEMVNFSTLIYQVDEFMELTVERDFGDHLSSIKSMIHRICNTEDSISGISDGNDNHSGKSTSASPAPIGYPTEGITDIAHVNATITAFTQYALKNQAVVKSPIALQSMLRAGLEAFLRAHIVQAADNQRFAAQHGGNRASVGSPRSHEDLIKAVDTEQNRDRGALQFCNPRRTFYKWVHSTAADHTSCPFSYIFYNCLVSNPNPGLFATAKSSYLAEDLCLHLASLCRMYNDLGSLLRDQDEYNLNSVNFPEFHGNNSSQRASKEIQSELMWIAEYERMGLDKVLSILKRELKAELFDSLKVFVNVTDLYGQIYLQRDLTPRQGILHVS